MQSFDMGGVSPGGKIHFYFINCQKRVLILFFTNTNKYNTYFLKNEPIIIAYYRLSTIRNADEILVMKKGTLVERGTHEELLKLDGVYRKLISKQIEENALK